MAQTILRAAVVGGSTLLGRELLNEIANSSAATWDLQLLEEGEESEGQLTAAGEEALVVHSLSREAFAGLDVVFFAATREITAEYVGAAVQAGVAVVDLTGAAKGQTGFLLRSGYLPDSPRPDLTTAGIVVPHPAALTLALVGQRLTRALGPVLLAATVLEPASEAGSAGVDELHQQTVSLLSFQDVPKAVFDAQIAFNVQAVLGEESKVDLPAVKRRMTEEITALTGPAGGEVSLQLLQAPVFHGYVISLYVRGDGVRTPEALERAVEGTPVVVEATASNRSATETGDVLVSLAPGAEPGQAQWLLLAIDNLRMSARSAIQAAMELTALRPGDRVQ